MDTRTEKQVRQLNACMPILVTLPATVAQTDARQFRWSKGLVR